MNNYKNWLKISFCCFINMIVIIILFFALDCGIYRYYRHELASLPGGSNYVAPYSYKIEIKPYIRNLEGF